jgi:hypothetical protein
MYSHEIDKRHSLNSYKVNSGTKLFCYFMTAHVIVLIPDVLIITHTGNQAYFQ